MKLLLLLTLLVCSFGYFVIWVPGRSYRGALSELSQDGLTLQERLSQHVKKLAGEIGPRSVSAPSGLERAEDYIQLVWSEAGFSVAREDYSLSNGTSVSNFFVEVPGSDESGVLVIGAHYDSVGADCPGANDNASGVAAVIELAKRAQKWKPKHTLRFVTFVNEEPPFFRTTEMGSFEHARRVQKKGENIVGMLSIETIGFFSDASGSQKYPFPLSLFYPSSGDFIGFVSNMSSRAFLHRVIAAFRKHVQFPSEGIAAPSLIPGVSWSDQWSFWQHGYPALMITDTAPFRYPHYHQTTDTPDKIDYKRMTQVVLGIEATLAELAGV